MKRLRLTVMLIAMFTISSCKKEGDGGSATITGYTKHHAKPISSAVIYIKYGAKEFPGTSPSSYDASVTSDANGKFEFKNLNKGNYYLFGSGYDSAISAPVIGGVPVNIKNKGETVNANVPITE